jgi:hypothetical protein
MAKELKYGDIEIEGIPEDEPIFIFRAQDCFAHALLETYAQLRFSAGDKEGSDSVRHSARRFSAWPVKKIPT